MYAIMTVTGKDHTGIIAAVTTALAKLDVNILDVSQTIMDQWFTMILRVELPDDSTITGVHQAMEKVEEDQSLTIRLQSEELFSAVNEI
ncbi:putative ACT-domain protein [Corynebacterium renale]|uniref:ACT domain-containing protein n=1 Tax=Corynebacterium renale TaxID=1724 RepID=UPI000DA3A164|nr:ACT domain-containing protein [Corynebacterium renale]SQG64715.1 putative ACT-domain protein [Corynebacterium renale]STC96026.1 putative ACT-domain protein [Corynebacterium renale]